MKIKQLVFAATAALALINGASAQNIIGVTAPTGATRSNTYPAAGYEFYAPSGTGTTINALGFWDQSGTGLLAAHQVSLFHYNGANYSLMATVTVPPGTNAPLINGYRWVGIPTLALPDNGQGGGYYAILAAQNVDAWTDGSGGGAPVMDSAIGTISGHGLFDSGLGQSITAPVVQIVGNGDPSSVYGGANLGFLTNTLPASSGAITWGATGTFTDNTVLSLAGTPAHEVYGVDFGGSGPQTTANNYTFDDYVTTGNMSIAGGGFGLFGGYMSGSATTGDGALDTILTDALYGSSGNTATLNNLTVGKTYTVMALLDDTRGVSAGASSTFNVLDGVTTSPSQQFEFANGSPSVGGYIMGTFTATATTQPFTVRNGGSSQYNAVILFTNPPPAVPLPILINNTQPASATAGVNGQNVFTAAFSNSPPVSLQWQVIANGVTNNVSAGVVNVTNLGVVFSTLTFTNLQLANSGSYQLKAVNATNGAGVTYSTPAPLAVVPLIQWLQTGTFVDNTVLALAGTAANEAYGADFGGSGLQTTANGYTFDDYVTAGNMSVAGGGFGLYNNYLGGGGSTGDTALDNLINFGYYGSSANSGTLSNLTIGQTYNVLAILGDTRGAPTAGAAFYGTEGVFASPTQVEAFTGGSPAIGGYALGRFTALATTQPFSLVTQTTSGNYANSQYNAILLVKTTAPVLPSIYLATDTQPAAATAPEGGQVVFTAAFFNVPAVNLQWQVITNGVTNNISGGVVSVTNLGVVTSTLTLTNLKQVNDGSYRLKAVNATNSADFAYSTPAPLTVLPTITWGATGTFTDNSVLALAGTPANEVYGVDFGGSGLQTTANGYTFDDYATTGNMSIAGGGVGLFGGYMTGGAATGDAALDSVLTFGLYGGSANTGTLNNLTVGQAYRVLVLLDDTRGGSAGSSSTFTVTDSVTTSPSQLFEFANGSPSVGGYIMGTFTATATTKALTVRNGGASQYNAILVTKSVPVPPTLGTVKASGGNLILTGTGGTPNSPYTWLSTTNLSAPITWTTNSTGTLDGTGAFSNAIPISATTPASFFRLRMP